MHIFNRMLHGESNHPQPNRFRTQKKALICFVITPAGNGVRLSYNSESPKAIISSTSVSLNSNK